MSKDAVVNQYEFFKTPIHTYSNTEIVSELKDYIYSIKVNGISSGVAPMVKTNIDEGRFDFLNADIPIINKTRAWFTQCVGQTLNYVQREQADYTMEYQSWYHVSKTNSVHESHIHIGCSWCGVFIVDAGDPDNGGQTVYESPFNCVYVDRGTRWIDEQAKHRVLPKTGLLTVFPSYLSHYQQLYTGQKDRVMVGFNTIVHNAIPNTPEVKNDG